MKKYCPFCNHSQICHHNGASELRDGLNIFPTSGMERASRLQDIPNPIDRFPIIDNEEDDDDLSLDHGLEEVDNSPPYSGPGTLCVVSSSVQWICEIP